MVSQIVGSTKFDGWAKSCDSQRLLIEDNHTRDFEAAGALSWFSSLLVKTLTLRAEFVPTVFFCGLHTESSDDYTGVRPMMRSLISQLLQQMASKFDIDLTQMVSHNHIEWELPDLLRFFELLVKQIPPQGTLVCILDGINYYENAAYEDDLLCVLRCLIGLTNDDGMLSAIKVLATSATKTIAAHEIFQIEKDTFHDNNDAVLLAITELPIVGDDVDESDLSVDWPDR